MIELCLELQKYITNINGMKFIHSPYIVSLYNGTDIENECYNNQYNKIKNMMQIALKKKDYKKYLFLCSRPYRLQKFLEIFLNITNNNQLFDLLEYVWIDSENPSINIDVWKELFSLPQLKSIFEKTKIDLPEKVIIYRGTNKSNDTGISWTLDYNIAKMFANNNFTTVGDIDGIVLEKEVNKKDIIFYTNRRNEKEIIYF